MNVVTREKKYARTLIIFGKLSNASDNLFRYIELAMSLVFVYMEVNVQNSWA